MTDASLGRVFSEFERPVRALCRRLLEQPQDAEDAAQETFLKIVRAFGRYDSNRPLRSWVFAIATRTCLDHLKRRRPVLFEEVEVAVTDRRLDPGDLSKVRSLLPEMPIAYRIALELKYAEGMSSEEIQQVLEISPENLRVRLFRARQWLRRAVGLNKENHVL
jgi:RNA polymerase sigma-70 factor (ECF subfamily)